jgi:DNA mismatch repair protein MutL
LGRIRKLSDATINRIAAGEVIERPAAAARELVENALDAGATRIRISASGGGIDRIEIVDDGSGMDGEELALAVQRHATSKLTDETLVRISTLGFRGEALPSIGAAARLSITSRPHGADSACSISVEGGIVSPVRPAAGAPGTRVEMRDLFFATPARRKFLKSPRAEADALHATMQRLAIAAPDVAFALEIDGHVHFDLPSQSLQARVAALLGVACTLPIEGVRGDMRVSGFIAPPSVTRATSMGQILVVNGRPVTDPVLRTAVRVGTRDGVASGRFAVLALFLTLPPEDVDVNVHPAKAELRFRAADAVRGLVITAIGRALASGAGGIAPSAGFAPRVFTPSYQPRHAGFGHFAEAPLPLEAPPSARSPVAEPAPSPDHPLGAAVAQVMDTYILAVADGALILVDQHAAHERLTQEALREQMLEGAVRTQALLLPEVVELPQADVARLIAHEAQLARLGVEIEAFGSGALLVRALPAALGAPGAAALLRDVADEFAEQDESTAIEARLDAAIARLACHGSIRAGRKLAAAEMDALLRQMEATPRAATCSHGRPTFLRLTRAELERMFGRRQ